MEESRDPEMSPRREEVGRRTLGAIGGFLLSFFYRARFQLFTRQFPMFVEKLQKLPLTSLQAPREWKNRTLLEKLYPSDVAIPLEDEFSTKSGTAIDTMQSVKMSQLYGLVKIGRIGTDGLSRLYLPPQRGAMGPMVPLVDQQNGPWANPAVGTHSHQQAPLRLSD